MTANATWIDRARLSVARFAVQSLLPDQSTAAQGLIANISHMLKRGHRRNLPLEQTYGELAMLRAVLGRIADSVAMQGWYMYRPASKKKQRRKEIGAVVQQSMKVEVRMSAIRQLVKDGDLVEVPEHPILRMICGGNGLITGFDIRRLTSIYLDLVGEVPWILDRHPKFGLPEMAYPVPPSWCERKPTAQEPTYKFRNLPKEVAREDVVWFSHPDPENPYAKSSGLARSLEHDLDGDLSAAEMIARSFYNDGRPDTLVTGNGVPKAAEGPELRRMERSWKAKALRKLPFFVGGEVKVHQLGHSMEQVQMVPVRKFLRDTILQTAGMPGELLGVLENGSNRSTIDLADAFNGKYNALPRLIRMREIFETQVLPQYPNSEGVVLDFENPIQADLEFQLKAMRAQPSSPTQAEWREFQGLPERQGTDVHIVKGAAYPRLDQVKLIKPQQKAA